VDIASVFRKNFFSNAVDLFNDRILAHGVSSLSSTGVQITGGSKPLSRHARLIFARKVAFAKWRQFRSTGIRPLQQPR
jgi:hypothetical protein